MVGIIDDDEWTETIEQVFRQVYIFFKAESGRVVEKLISFDLKVSKGKAQRQDRCWRCGFLRIVAAALFPVNQNRGCASSYPGKLIEVIFDPKKMPMKIEDLA